MKKILVFLLLIPVISAQLGSYPDPFVRQGVFDGKLVVGQNAATSDVIGAVDIAASLVAESGTDISLGRMTSLFDTHLGVLDIDAPELGTENLIVVGGPCINAVAAQLLGYPQPCNRGFEIGKAMIQYFPDDRAILVAGYEAQETLAASYVLADYEDYGLSGEKMEITIAGQGVLSISSVN